MPNGSWGDASMLGVTSAKLGVTSACSLPGVTSAVLEPRIHTQEPTKLANRYVGSIGAVPAGPQS